MASFKDVIFEESKVRELIPQKEPFIMVGKLLFNDSTRAVTSFIIKEDNILVEDNKFSASGIIENIAQTAGVRVGHFNLLNNMATPSGYIGSVSNLIIYDLPEVNQEITTEVILMNEIMSISIIKGIVRIGDKVIAECEMKIFIKND